MKIKNGFLPYFFTKECHLEKLKKQGKKKKKHFADFNRFR